MYVSSCLVLPRFQAGFGVSGSSKLSVAIPIPLETLPIPQNAYLQFVFSLTPFEPALWLSPSLAEPVQLHRIPSSFP